MDWTKHTEQRQDGGRTVNVYYHVATRDGIEFRIRSRGGWGRPSLSIRDMADRKIDSSDICPSQYEHIVVPSNMLDDLKLRAEQWSFDKWLADNIARDLRSLKDHTDKIARIQERLDRLTTLTPPVEVRTVEVVPRDAHVGRRFWCGPTHVEIVKVIDTTHVQVAPVDGVW